MPEFLNDKFSNSTEMCNKLLQETGVALLPGSDFGFLPQKMLARLSFTDFDGAKLMENFQKTKNIDLDTISSLAPNIIEGIKKLKEWSDSL